MPKNNKTLDTGQEPKKRVIESKFDASKLRSLIEAKKSAAEIMESMNIKHKQTLKQYLLRLISLDRKVYEISDMYLRNLKRPVVNFKGEIKISKNMIDFPGCNYTHGDHFDIEADNEKIILTRIIAS